GSSQGLATTETAQQPAFVPSPGPGLTAGAPGTKPVGQYTLVGVSPGPPRIDIPGKVTGIYTYVHSIRVPGMLHGRIVRPRGQGAYGDGSNPKPLSVDAGSIAHIPGAKIVQKGNFLGVTAPKEYDAIQAAAELKVTWAPPPVLSGSGNVFGAMRTQDTAGQVKASTSTNVGNDDPAPAAAAKSAQPTKHYP